MLEKILVFFILSQSCHAYELNLLSLIDQDPGEYNVEIDKGADYGQDAYKFDNRVKKIVLPYETATEIITQLDAHNAFILTANLKLDLDKYGSIFSVTGYTGEVLLDVWVKSGVNPGLGVRYTPINSTKLENLVFSPVLDFRRGLWNKVVLHAYSIGLFQSVLDVYVNCERVGRKVTRSLVDLFVYQKRFATQRLEFRVGQKGYAKDVYSRFQGSMQSLYLVFKRDINEYNKKSQCTSLNEERPDFSTFRALTEPIYHGSSVDSAAVGELLSLVKDLRHDLTVQASEIKYVRKLLEGCDVCRVTNYCAMKPCYPGVHCYHAPKSERGFFCGNCPLGSHGDGINCTDIDECMLKPCSVYSKCINKSPGYSCAPCAEGFTGATPFGIGLRHAAETKQVCSDIDECSIDNGGCDALVKCRNTVGSYKCDPCPAGYEGDPRVGCRFKQYCARDNPESNPCHKFAKCKPINEGKDFVCKCRVGFAGDGFLCSYDSDADGFPNVELNCTDRHCRKDNCPRIANKEQADRDGDKVGDLCDYDVDNDRVSNKQDNCKWVKNPAQRDSDYDGIGDKCDNCPGVKNPQQEDYDDDGIGDECDYDTDGDDVSNDEDNCQLIANKDQTDTDDDGIGDACDNCKNTPNSDQADSDSDGLGDSCDDDIDQDNDGVEDIIDNCIKVSNPEQIDSDSDGIGNACDKDDDNDSILDEFDNCPLVTNKEQRDVDASGVGEVCTNDWDGDGVPDVYDANKEDNAVKFTDFRRLQKVNLDSKDQSKANAEWIVRKKGTNVRQTVSSDPGLVVGMDRFAGVDFNGTMYVDSNHDDDFIGIIFSYQDSSHFYAIIWKKSEQIYWNEKPFRAIATAGLQVKRVESSSGPGVTLRNALWHNEDTEDEVKVLWSDSRQIGWESRVRYHWQLIHRPEVGLIRFRIFHGRRRLVDTGFLNDKTYAGGKLGMYAFSQTDVVWTSLSYRADDEIPQGFYKRYRKYMGKLRRI